jgi:glycosyltransferase involved in cell wall biosynthesis
MRVAFLVPGRMATVSGGYGYDRAIVAGLRGLGHTVDVFELAGAHPLPNAAAEAAARAAWAAMAADAVPVIDGLGLPAFAPLAAALAARGAVGLIHHPTALEAGRTEEARAALKAIEARLFPMLRRLIVTSPATAERVAAEFGADPARVRVVVPGTAEAPRAAGSGGPGCEILAVGGLIPRKGHDMLIRALARLFDLDWRLTIAGGPLDGAHAHTLRALAAELGVAQRVTFAGEVVDAALEALWARADIFALATQFEGYGMAIAEALKRGLPVAVTNGGAAGALVTPEAGIVCDIGDVVNFSKAIRRLIFDVKLRADAAEAAWRIGRTLPDWPAQAAAFAEALA